MDKSPIEAVQAAIFHYGSLYKAEDPKHKATSHIPDIIKGLEMAEKQLQKYQDLMNYLTVKEE